MTLQERQDLYNKVKQACGRLDSIGRRMYGQQAKRFITFKQEIALRLCHHDFYGLSIINAATIMHVTPRAVYDLLNRIEEIAPQFFPILTQRQSVIYDMLIRLNMTPTQIAIILNIDVNSIYNSISDMIKYCKIKEINCHLDMPELWFPSNICRRVCRKGHEKVTRYS